MKKGFSTTSIVAVAIGAALFGVLMVYGGITVFTNTKLTTAYIIPVVVGGLFGPIPAGLVGLLGNIIADFLFGGGYWFDWSIGNFVACAFIGSLSLYGARIREGKFEIKHAIIFAIVSVLGTIFAFGLVTPLFTQVFYGGELKITILQSQAVVITNSAVLLLAGIPLLFLLASRYKKQNNLVKED